jgi:hypothetical protein
MTNSSQTVPAGSKRTPLSRWLAFGSAAAGIGLLFLCCGFQISVISLVLLPLGTGALTVGILASQGKLRGAAPLRIVLAGLAALGAMLVPTSIAGFVIRHLDRGDYLRWYGTHVEATVDTRKCEWINKGRHGNTDTMGCQGVTWIIDGRQQTGSMEIKGEDHPAAAGVPDVVKVAGYALDDAAVTDRDIRTGYQAGRLGAVPLWAGGAGLLLLAAGYGGLSALGKRSTAR